MSDEPPVSARSSSAASQERAEARADRAPRGQRAAQKLRTRNALADAARELFAEQGYAETTAEQIAARAGVSRATFYLHFSGKGDIVVDLMRALAGDLREDMRRLASARTLAQAEAWVESHARTWSDYEAEFVAMRQALGVEQVVSDEWFAFIRSVAADVDAWMGEDAAGEPRQVAIAVFLLGVDRTLASVLQSGFDLPWELVLRSLAVQWLAITSPPQHASAE